MSKEICRPARSAYIEGLEVELPNTDWCNIAGEANGMQEQGKYGTDIPNSD